LAKPAAVASGDAPTAVMRHDEGSIMYFTSGSTGMLKAVQY